MIVKIIFKRKHLNHNELIILTRAVKLTRNLVVERKNA